MGITGSGPGVPALGGASRLAARLSVIAACAVPADTARAAEPVAVTMKPVAGEVQSGGPQYDFRISVQETTNQQFADFLNDALNHPDDERGHYLYHATDTGNVYIHSSQTGAQGPDSGGTLILEASVNGRIVFSEGSYGLSDPAFADHAVTGVSWYATVKFCNWLTLASGLSAEQRAYTEAPSSDLSSWHPVSISEADWAVRDLNDADREALLDVLGYRLPMDDGSATQSAYNEWYKAAAYDGAGGYWIYGFGGDEITGADANYWNSGDPYDNGTTPGSYYDGTDHGGVFATNDTQNVYGLYDVSGNVWEWMQDQAVTTARRAVRGGSWQSSACPECTSLRCATRSDLGTSTVLATTGFRVVQVVPGPLLVVPDTGLTAAGPFGGEYDTPELDYTITNVTADQILLSVVPDVSWLTIDGEAALQNQPLDAGARITVTVAVDTPCGAEDLELGLNGASIDFFADVSTNGVTREVTFTMTEPLGVAPSDDLTASGVLGGSFEPAEIVYTISSASASAVDWVVSADADWVTINGVQANGWPVEGTITPPDTQAQVTVALDGSTDLLGVGTHTAGVTFTDSCTGQTFTRSVVLEVGASLTVTPPGDGALEGLFPAIEYTITSLSANPIDWEVVTDDPEALVYLNGGETAAGELPAEAEVVVTVEPSPTALSLAPGEYTTPLRFRDKTNTENVYEITRQVTLTILGLGSSGPVGGPFSPAERIYTIQNDGAGELPWQATYETTPPGGDWLSLNGGPTAEGTIIEAGGTAEVTVAINDNAAALEAGSYSAEVTFENLLSGASTTRSVELQVAIAFSIPMAVVDGADAQPDGPGYSYRIGRYEVTNSELAAFLNSALLHPDDARGHYMYHDIDSGNVYVNAVEMGDVGTDGAGTLLFEAVCGGAISYDDVGQRYEVASGLEDFPVVGVSWYGAVKFCNWMTLIQGMSESGRAYSEGADPGQWHPVGISDADWAVRDLDASEREALVTSIPGFRLPMDEGQATASAYNEWYKAAAWEQESGTNAIYGFGRDSLTEADANFLNSGDPYDNDTTPVGFFDGVNLLADGETFTTDTENGYGLYDLCGNVAEWVQDHGAGPTQRATRSGNALNDAGSPELRADGRTSDLAGATRSSTGFRVVQSLPGDPIEVTPETNFLADGVVGGPFTLSGSQGLYTLSNASTQSREWLVTTNVSWLDVNGAASASGILRPGETTEITVSLNDAAAALLEPAGPSIQMAPVPADDAQPSGPDYDYCISIRETTNSRFAAFLNDALNNPNNQRGYYMYHDTDSGDVYIHSAQQGDVGTDGLGTKLFDAAASGRIGFSDNAYVVEQGHENDPVTGVTWYGAAKYCNWLTLSECISPSQLAYSEGTNPGQWHPATISEADWAVRDLEFDERQELIENHCGYRLPMDDGSGTASTYNEWYKAAAWLPDAGTNAVYGFGRDELGGADANFLDSGDPYEDETPPLAPTGFFDGVNTLADGETVTRDTDNGYGLYDVTGNAAEWMQDTGATAAERAVRGGDFNDPGDPPSPSLTNANRESADPAAPADDLGFRVVQSKRAHLATITFTDLTTAATATRQVILTVAEPITVEPAAGLVSTGPFRGPFDPPSEVYTLANGSESAMSWQVTTDAAWIDINTNGTASGELAGGEAVDVAVSINTSGEELPPGEYTATVSFHNTTSGGVQTRPVELTVAEAITVLPQEDFTPSGLWGGPFEALQLEQTYTIDNLLDIPLDYSVTADADWITVNDGEPAGGTLDPQAPPAEVPVAVNANADLLDVGEYEATITFAFDDYGVGGEVTRTVTLTVLDVLDISPADDITAFYTPPGDPLLIEGATYTLTNLGELLIGWQVTCDQSWVTIDGGAQASGDLLPEATDEVVIAFDPEVDALGEGVYTATVSFENLLTAHVETRGVTLTVDESLGVLPQTGLDAYGAVGQPVVPGQKVYTLTNWTDEPLDWQAARADPAAAWVLIDAADQAAGTLAPGGQTDVVVSIDQGQVAGFGAGSNSAEVEFRNVSESSIVALRTVTVTLTEPSLVLDLRAVSGADAQPGGPQYLFEMAAFPVTNAEFAVFLNDALNNLGNERGYYMYHDVDSGDVFINATKDGEAGTDGSGTLTTRMYSASVNADRISFDTDAYAVTPGFGEHPVTSVSWYGAVKYCNWLTIDQGLGPPQRCYSEGPADDLDRWRPVTIAGEDWPVRDLDDGERQTLVDECGGFRLPMDDGANNAQPWSDAADAYDEWYKAAAWDQAAGVNRVFGFGRDTVTGADANYLDSGDPFDNGTTPVGYYDGSDHGGTFATNDTQNAYGLYDVSGNVAEWVQDHYSTASNRAVRGGSWASTEAQEVWLRNVDRNVAPPGLVWGEIGFRVVRVFRLAGDGNGDGQVDLADYAILDGCLTGPDGGPMEGSCAPIDFDGDDDVDLQDFAAFQTALSAP